MSRPVIKIKPTKFDMVLEVIALLLLVVMWGYVIYYWSSLPDDPDSPVKKFGVFVFPGLASFFSWLCLYWAHYPQREECFRVMVTEENAERQFCNLALSMRVETITINLMISGATIWAVSQVAAVQSRFDALAVPLVWIGGMLLVITAILFSFRARRLK